MSRILTTLIPESVESGLEDCRRALIRGADMVEFRLDLLTNPRTVLDLVRRSPAPVLASCRVRADGGWFDGDADLRREMLVAAAEGGAEWIDVEHWEGLSLPGGLRTRLLRSYHKLDGAPRDLLAIVDRMAYSGADAVKVTLMGYDAADIRVVDELYKRHYPVPVTAFLAGETGVASRYLASMLGAPFLYTAPEPGREAAPGQPTLWEAIEVFHARRLGLDTCFWGLMGSPVRHSLGYRLHNGLGRWLREVPVYLPFETKHPETLLSHLRGFGPRFLGLSVTAPHKGRVLDLLDGVGPEAKECRAANTIIHRDGMLIGQNTDVEGIRRALRRGYEGGRPPTGARALVLGAGGAARAACMALAKDGLEVSVASRSQAGIRDFAQVWGFGLLPIDPRAIRGLDPAVVVHATPVGSAGAEDKACLLEVGDIPRGSVVLDLVYRPVRTELLRRATEAGARPVSGLWMFLHQAYLQIAHVLGSQAGLPGLESLSLLLGPEGRELREPAH
ncbi:MAG: type I 3-dehydroquinate dehydratase [Planctomycetota bacterium]